MFQDAVRKSIYGLLKSSEKEILDQIKEKDVISFDVFDTLIKRDVAPENVYSVIEKKIKKNAKYSICNFAAMRIQAEKEARSKKAGSEVTLQEIYACMPIEKECREELLKIECDVEERLAFANLPIKRIYDKCIKLGKIVYFISDMYLPEDVVLRILDKNGYSNGKLYISSESRLTKRTGELFKYVHENERLEFTHWAHIGDSFSSDYIVPKYLGIKALLVERNHRCNEYIQKRIYKKNENYRCLNYFIDSRLVNYTNTYEKIGYAVLGPMLYGFSKWLEREIPEEETILFLARDGALLKKAFELITDRPSIYFRISRQAVNAAFIDYAVSPETVLDSKARAISKNSFQKEWAVRYGLSNEEADDIFAKNNLFKDRYIRSRKDEEQILTAIWTAIKEKASGQHELLQGYLNQLGVSEKVALVDVGWKGTIQTFLRQSEFIAGGVPIQWNGYYMGNAKWPEKSEDAKRKRGFLFDSYPGERIYDSFMNSVPFCESFFLSTDGTTNGYKKTGENSVEPVLGPLENALDPIILSLQNGGMQFVKDIIESPVKEFIHLDAECAAGNYEALARVPSLKTLKLFKESKFYDVDAFTIISEHTIFYYLFHPKEFIHNCSLGKCWFLKSVLKVPFPYIQFLNLIRKLMAG